MTIEISRIEISFSIHATEDEEKNMHALKTIITPEIFDEIKITPDKIEGGYTNPITFVEFVIKRNRDIKLLMMHLVNNITEEDKKVLEWEYNERFDEDRKSFHLRFDKQEAFKGNIKLVDSANCIKMLIKLQTYDRDPDFHQFLTENGLVGIKES